MQTALRYTRKVAARCQYSSHNIFESCSRILSNLEVTSLLVIPFHQVMNQFFICMTNQIGDFFDHSKDTADNNWERGISAVALSGGIGIGQL